MGIRSVPALVILWALVGCHTANTEGDGDSERLRDLVSQYRKDVSIAGLKTILVVAEEGCPTCNKSLAKLVEGHLSDTTSLVWVSAMGGMVDISQFRAAPDRVVWDYGDSLRSLGIIKGSGAIFLDAGRLDTVIQLDARNLGRALTLLSARLEARIPAPMDSLINLR